MGVPMAYYAEAYFGDDKVVAYLSDELGRKSREWNNTRHVSGDYELHVILDGAAQLELSDGKRTISHRQAVMLAPNVSHASQSEPKALIHLCVHFSAEGERLKEALQTVVPRCAVFPVQEDVAAMTRDLLQELTGDGIYRLELLRTLLPPLIIKVFRAAGILVDSKNTQQDDDLGRRFIIGAFFNANMPYGKDEERLAKELGLSTRQLSRFLLENYGMNFRQMLLHSRMEHAAWMLRSTGLSVGEIAEKLKYTSISAFSQAFRSIYHMTPTAYRKANQ